MSENRPPAAKTKGIHHGAFRCLDAEQTRWFYVDVLGLELAGGVVIEAVPGTGADDPYMHLFFRMGNGEFIAFFDAPGSAGPDSFGRKESFDMHWAFELSTQKDLLAMQDRVRSFGINCGGPLDHHFVRSIYMYDPNGIQIEFTIRVPDHDRILAEEAGDFDVVLRDWSERTRAAKIAKFGVEAIERRTSAPRRAS